MHERQYWIGVASRDGVDAAIAGGYAEVNRGKAGPLERMAIGDGFAFYSPRTAWPDGETLQAFTGIGRVRSADVFQAADGGGQRPFRLPMEWLPAQPAPIRPLIDQLSFIRSKPHWGAALRFGFVRVPKEDFALIACAMGRAFGNDFAL